MYLFILFLEMRMVLSSINRAQAKSVFKFYSSHIGGWALERRLSGNSSGWLLF